MRTTFDDIPEVNVLGPADRILAPEPVQRGRRAVRAPDRRLPQALIEGREPHSVFLTLEDGTDPDAVLPPDVEIVRSAVDDEDTALLAKGLGYTVLASTSGPMALVSAVSRDQAKAVADTLRGRAKELSNPPDTRTLGQYL